MKNITLILLTFITFSIHAQDEKSEVDYEGFTAMTEEVEAVRAERLISIEEFNEMAKDENTIILDSRSLADFNTIHIAGATHLNFSEFTTKSLAETIPSKDTRILIYCNNNFLRSLDALYSKAAPLALNIPTFINLYGYGYENVYELSGMYLENDERIDFVKSEEEED